MKRKIILAMLTAAIMALGTIGVLALDYPVPEDALSLTTRFYILESDELGAEFSMISEDGDLVINITDNTLIYFEDFIPLDDDNGGMTQMVREVLFGSTLAEVLDGRNMRVLYEESEHIEPLSVMVLFEAITTLPALVGEEPSPLPEAPVYDNFRGVIKEINPFYQHTENGRAAVEGKYYVLVTNSSFTMLDNGAFEEVYFGSVNFIIDQNTLFYPRVDLEVGLPVTGFYDTNLPITRIYPPQHHARVMITGHLFFDPTNRIGSYFVDYFDMDLESYKNNIRLVINENYRLQAETEIIFEDGSPFEGNISELGNRTLLVLSGPLPSLIPGAEPTQMTITNPYKIIILF